MRKKVDKIKNYIILNRYCLLFAFILGTFIFKYNYVLGDDTKFLNELFSQGFFKMLIHDYLNWSGRVSSTMIYFIILPHIKVWKILNIIVAFLFIKGLSNYYKDEVSNLEKIEIDKMIIKCFFFVSIFIILSSYVWMTGSFQYIWVIVAFLYAMHPFYNLFFYRKLKFSIYKWIWYYCCMFYASYVEQESLIILVLGIISVIAIYRKKDIKHIEKRKIYYYYIFFLINFFISRISPGLGNRIEVAKAYYPNWDNIPFIFKFYEAFILSSKNLILGSNLLFFILLLLLSILIYKKFGTKFKVLFIPIFYMILNIIPFDYLMSSIMLDNNRVPILNSSKELSFFLFDIGKVVQDIKIAKIEYLPIVIILFVIIFSSFILLIIFEDKNKGRLNFLVYWAGLFSGYIIAFMPVMYGIGTRACFITVTCFLFVISQLYLELKLKYEIDKNLYFKILKIILTILSFVIILSYHTRIIEKNFY